VVETTTKNYGWTKPEIAASPATWGGFLNTNLDSIDALVFANQQGLSPVGSGALWFTTTPPANWLICDGSSLSTTGTYAALFAAIGYTFGGSGASFNLPNIQNRFPIGAGSNHALGAAGGASNVTLSVAQLPPHAHPITDVVHNHGINQSSHAHVIATGAHSHAIATGGHAHGASLMRFVGSGGTLGVGVAPNNVTYGNTDAVGALGGNTDTAGNLGGNTDTQTTAVSINASGTGLSTTQNAGSGSAVPITPPYLAINFIIRYA
jgi:microcystin-dependent protein